MNKESFWHAPHPNSVSRRKAKFRVHQAEWPDWAGKWHSGGVLFLLLNSGDVMVFVEQFALNVRIEFIDKTTCAPVEKGDGCTAHG